MHDSGDRTRYPSGAVRDRRAGKLRPDLISPIALARLGAWLALGAEKYGDRNWEKGMPISDLVASADRHWLKWKLGCVDEDHLAAVLFNVMAIIHTLEQVDDGQLPAELLDYAPATKGADVLWRELERGVAGADAK